MRDLILSSLQRAGITPMPDVITIAQRGPVTCVGLAWSELSLNNDEMRKLSNRVDAAMLVNLALEFDGGNRCPGLKTMTLVYDDERTLRTAS